MKHYFGIENPREFILKYYANCHDFPEISGFAKIVGNMATFDEEALKIIYSCSNMLVNSMLTLFRKAHLRDCTAGIYGSVLLCNPLIRNRFESGVTDVYPQAKIMVPSIKPEIAALKYIHRKERSK